MRAKLEYELPEDINEFKLACNAREYHSALWDLDQHLRGYLKYDSHEFKTAEEVMEWVRTYIYDSVKKDLHVALTHVAILMIFIHGIDNFCGPLAIGISDRFS